MSRQEKNNTNNQYQAVHDQLIKKIVEEHWGFTKQSWRFLDDFHNPKIKDDGNLSTIRKFSHVVDTIKNILKPTTVFIYLNKIVTPDDYSSEYKGMHLALLVLFHLITGETYRNMSTYTPGTSFYSVHAKFYQKLGNLGYKSGDSTPLTLDTMFSTLFSTSLSRIAAARGFNEEKYEEITKSITLTTIVYDSRAIYIKGEPAEIPKDRESKRGVRTLLCFDRNNYIYCTKSGETGCKEIGSKYLLDYDKDILLKIELPKLIKKEDRVLIQNTFKPIISNNIDLKELKYSYFTEKPSSVENFIKTQNALKHLMIVANNNLCDFLGSFRRFTYQNFSQTKGFESYGLEVQLAALLFNVDKFITENGIKEEEWHSEWTKPDFGYRYTARTPSPVEIYDIEEEINDREEVGLAQERMFDELIKKLETEKITVTQDMDKSPTNDSGLGDETSAESSNEKLQGLTPH